MSDPQRLQRGDIVDMVDSPTLIGRVLRVARDETWVDVHWDYRHGGWVKRQRRPNLVLLVMRPKLTPTP